MTRNAPAQRPQPICRVDALRALERGAGEAQLMERAGAAAAHDAAKLIRGSTLPVLIVCGPGNNGGDGLVVARLLKQRGIESVVVLSDASRLPADARAALEAWQATGGNTLGSMPADGRYALAVDALFGIGLQRPVEGMHARHIDALNALPCPVLALDIPSGLDADSGRILGKTVRATHTSTFLALKPGLLTLDGPDHCGENTLHTLGLRADDAGCGHTVARELFAACLAPRARNTHKGTMGSVAVIGGASGMVGALLLAARAALKLGAGRVYGGMVDERARGVDPVQPELMLRAPRELIEDHNATALAVGPGLGMSDEAAVLLRVAIDSDLPLVLDADALNLAAAHPVLGARIPRRKAPTLITPHPAEAARLLQCDTAEVQHDRVGAALRLAQKFKTHAVLKGNGSIVACPDGRWFVNTTGNPGMASAGMGDVLTGLAVALLARGAAADAALLCAVHLHGAAADALVAQGIGPAGLTASEVTDAARRVFNNWCATSPAD